MTASSRPSAWSRALAGAGVALGIAGCANGVVPSGGASLEGIASQAASANESVVPSASVDPSTEPSASAEASPQIAIDDWVEVVVDGLHVRSGPSQASPSEGILSAGAQGLVVAGPVDADGYGWYALAPEGIPSYQHCPLGQDPVYLDCPTWFGWVAGARGEESWLAHAQLDCPAAPATLGELLDVPSGLRLPCFGGEALTFRAYLSPDGPDRGCVTGSFEFTPAYLSGCPLQFIQEEETPMQSMGHELGVQVHEDIGACEFGGFSPETCAFVPFLGQWVEVEGMYDHPDAATCTARPLADEQPQHADVVKWLCRSRFVVTEVRPSE